MSGQERRRAARRRLQALAGLSVRGSDGRIVGKVRDIYQRDADGELAAITVMPRQLSSRSVLIPRSALVDLPVIPAPAAPGGRPGDAAGAAAGTDSGADETADGAADDPADDAAGAVLHLRVEAAVAKAGLEPPQTLHATSQMLRDAAAALGLEEGPDGS